MLGTRTYFEYAGLTSHSDRTASGQSRRNHDSMPNLNRNVLLDPGPVNCQVDHRRTHLSNMALDVL